MIRGQHLPDRDARCGYHDIEKFIEKESRQGPCIGRCNRQERTSTGRTIVVIPVPAHEIVRADQKTTNTGFLHSLTIDLHLETITPDEITQRVPAERGMVPAIQLQSI